MGPSTNKVKARGIKVLNEGRNDSAVPTPGDAGWAWKYTAGCQQPRQSLKEWSWERKDGLTDIFFLQTEKVWPQKARNNKSGTPQGKFHGYFWEKKLFWPANDVIIFLASILKFLFLFPA